MSETNKDLVRKLNRALEAGDAGTIASLIHSDFTHKRRGLERTLPVLMAGAPKPPTPAAAFMRAGDAIQTVFDGWHAEEELLIAEGDWVIARQTMSGTLRGALERSERVNPKFSFPMVVMFRFVDGQVIEIWALGDELGFWEQMGLTLPVLALAE